MWAIWYAELRTLDRRFDSREEAETWLERILERVDPDLWLKTRGGYVRAASVDEYRINELSG